MSVNRGLTKEKITTLEGARDCFGEEALFRQTQTKSLRCLGRKDGFSEEGGHIQKKKKKKGFHIVWGGKPSCAAFKTCENS